MFLSWETLVFLYMIHFTLSGSLVALDSLYTRSCHLAMEAILLFPFKSEYFFFLYSCCDFRTNSTVLNKSSKTEIYALLLQLFIAILYISLKKFPSYFVRLLSWKGVEFRQMLLSMKFFCPLSVVMILTGFHKLN